MNRIDDDEVWMGVADSVARRSRCVRSQCGAVIVGSHGRIVATGYNGPAAGYVPAESGAPCDMWCVRAMNKVTGDASGADYSNCPSIHAEANALLYSSRRDVEGGTIYVTRVPCLECAKLISNSGIVRVHCRMGDAADSVRPVGDYLEYLYACNLDVDWLGKI